MRASPIHILLMFIQYYRIVWPLAFFDSNRFVISHYVFFSRIYLFDKEETTEIFLLER